MTLGNNFQLNSNRNAAIFIQENLLENVICKVAAILSQPICVKPSNPGPFHTCTRYTDLAVIVFAPYNAGSLLGTVLHAQLGLFESFFQCKSFKLIFADQNSSQSKLSLRMDTTSSVKTKLAEPPRRYIQPMWAVQFLFCGLECPLWNILADLFGWGCPSYRYLWLEGTDITGICRLVTQWRDAGRTFAWDT